ncbi:MAG: virulence factor SrfB [Pseudomonadota bacterium]
MPLAPVLDCPPTVWLIPRSGVQFVDLGFRLQGRKDLPTQWAFHDDAAVGPPRIVGRGDAEPTGRVSYEVDVRKILEMFDRTWLPLPILRRARSGGHDQGPTNWTRLYLTKLAEPDDSGYDHRLVVAFDTDLDVGSPDTAYLAPSPEDTQRGAEFSLADAPEVLDWYVSQRWVTDWCRGTVAAMIRGEERTRNRAPPVIDDAAIAARLDGGREEVARYLALLDLVRELRLLPAFRIVDRITVPRPAAIDVDLVLDVGNSRTCGLLVETHPDERTANVTNAQKLELRDLGRPERVYTDPFDSRIEFNRASFGRDDVSFLSGRADAFSWPTVARVGVEAQRLAGLRRGSEGATGMSSPKRYLWDADPRQDGWRFNAGDLDDQAGAYATGVAYTTLVNDAGEPLHDVPPDVAPNDDRRFPSIRAKYARSQLMAFALAEVLLQCFCMMNAPANRLKRPSAELPRRLARVIMTMPTAMPLAERQLLRHRATAARDLLFVCLGWAEVDPSGDGIVPLDDVALPEIVIEWDEASATQAAYLYSQIAVDHSGDARAFFDRARLPTNRTDPDLDDAFRLATLDIGGGTTDLVITSFRVEGAGANVTIFPTQILREGVSLAGDDVLFQIVVDHVLVPIREALVQSGVDQGIDVLMHRLFGGDRNDIDVADRLRRQQFAAHVGAPVALRLLQAYELWNPLGNEHRAEPFTLGDALGDAVDEGLLQRIEDEARRFGAFDFRLADVVIHVDLKELDRTTRSVLVELLRAMAELICRARADLLILSGRPSRLPAVFGAIVETCALPPHRIQPLHSFRVGSWYPFRDIHATIADPKTTAAVGAMICLLGEGRLRNFNYRSDRLRPRSTARFFGKLDLDDRLRQENVFFSDLDLDDEGYELPDQPFEFRGPMTLGYRQFGADWWPGAKLYGIDYLSPEAAARLNARTPLRVHLERVTGRGAKGVVDAFAIARIEDAEDRTVSKNQLRLRLQTIDNAEGYWLDTGVLLRS